MSIYYGDEEGKAKNIKSLYISINGKAKQIQKAWLGDNLGRARLVYVSVMTNPYFWYDIVETNGIKEAIVYGVRWDNWYNDFHNYDIIVPDTIENCPTIIT
jgi:hypothetical protein